VIGAAALAEALQRVFRAKRWLKRWDVTLSLAVKQTWIQTMFDLAVQHGSILRISPRELTCYATTPTPEDGFFFGVGKGLETHPGHSPSGHAELDNSRAGDEDLSFYGFDAVPPPGISLRVRGGAGDDGVPVVARVTRRKTLTRAAANGDQRLLLLPDFISFFCPDHRAEAEMTKFAMCRLLGDYVTKHKLRQDPSDRSVITCDTALKELVGRPLLQGFEVDEFLSRHSTDVIVVGASASASPTRSGLATGDSL